MPIRAIVAAFIQIPNRAQVISHCEIVRANILGGDDWWEACRGGGRPRRRGGAGSDRRERSGCPNDNYSALAPSFLFALASIFFSSDFDSFPFLTI
jgi:hypothetical protein